MHSISRRIAVAALALTAVAGPAVAQASSASAQPAPALAAQASPSPSTSTAEVTKGESGDLSFGYILFGVVILVLVASGAWFLHTRRGARG